MSRIGKQPVIWKDGTKVSFAGQLLTVEGGKTTLTQELDPCIKVTIDEDTRSAVFTRRVESKRSRAMHGLYRALAANMVEGVEQGFVKRLEIQGVGFNAKMDGTSLTLNIGYNAPVKLPIPAGVTVVTPTNTSVIVTGANKQMVGQFAAEVRALRKPEPYKGKGIRYEGELVRRKVGKSLGA